MIATMTDRTQLAWYSFRPFGAETSTLVRIHTAAERPLWHGLDVLRALDAEDVHLVDVVALPGIEDEDGELVPFIDTGSVIALGHGHADFLGWVDWTLSCIAAGRVQRHLVAVPHRPERPVVDIVDVRADSFSIVTAAALISRDPELSFGRETLFTSIRDLGWVKRDRDAAWIPTDAAVAAGWLALNPIWQRGTKVSYNKVRVTREGLLELHRLLGGIVPPDLDAPATPTLLEVL